MMMPMVQMPTNSPSSFGFTALRSMMTTGAMVLGAIPLALATGAGAETRTQIGWVIVGGMSLGTLLTIFVVPTMYTLFARKAVPGAKTALAADEPAHPLHPHGHDYVAK